MPLVHIYFVTIETELPFFLTFVQVVRVHENVIDRSQKLELRHNKTLEVSR